jgi:hypothetical protein
MNQKDPSEISRQDQLEIEAALFRKLVTHLQKYPEVQNIELMNLAYFCRNCFSKWYLSEASDRGYQMDYNQAREAVYGMPYSVYKEKWQTKATAKQLDLYDGAQKKATE